MTINIGQIISKLDSVTSVDEAKAVLSDLTKVVDFERYLFVLFLPDSMLRSSMVLLTNYPETWMEKYIVDDFKNIDPIVRHVRNSYLPVFWREIINEEKNFTTKDKAFMGLASEFGIRYGVSIPCHGILGEIGVLSLCSSASLTIKEEQNAIYQCHMLMPYIHQTIKRLQLSGNIKTTLLTKREKECLLWASEGKTAWEISQILKISERTVIFHLKNSMNKTNSINRQQAIVKSILMGEIVPEI